MSQSGSDEQTLNALNPIVLTLSGMVKEARALQPEQNLSPISDTPFGTVKDARLEQSSNARAPIAVTPLSGMVTDLRLVQP